MIRASMAQWWMDTSEESKGSARLSTVSNMLNRCSSGIFWAIIPKSMGTRCLPEGSGTIPIVPPV